MGKWKQVQQYGEHIASLVDVHSKSFSKSKGILLLDGTFLTVHGEDRVILIAYDTILGVVGLLYR